MRSRNPVFTRADGFNGRNNAYGNATYPGGGQGYSGFGTVGGGYTDTGVPQTHRGADAGPMTIDSVVQKTGLTIAVVVLVAAATWLLTGDVQSDPQAASLLYTLSLVGALGGFALSLVNSFKRVVSPPLVIAYAALEGLFVGAMSKVFAVTFSPGVVPGAVVGTVAAFAGTLAAYKFFNIRVGQRFRMWVTGLIFGFVALALLDFVLGLFGNSFGFNGFGTLGLLTSIVGLGLGVLMLILDFDYVERGIAAGLPERESWRAAFGLTVTLVWIYIELMRILAIITRR